MGCICCHHFQDCTHSQVAFKTSTTTVCVEFFKRRSWLICSAPTWGYKCPKLAVYSALSVCFMRYIWLSKSAGEYTWTAGIISSGHSKWWGVMKSTIPVGHREVIWSSAQNLKAITFNNARSFLVITRETHKRATLIPNTMDWWMHWSTGTCTQKHQLSQCKRNSKRAYTGVGALDTTSLGSFQQADPGGLHEPHWSFSVLSHCPPLLLLQLQPTALLWAPLHQLCSYRHCSGYRYIQHCGYMDSWSLLDLGCRCYCHFLVNKKLWGQSSLFCCSSS